MFSILLRLFTRRKEAVGEIKVDFTPPTPHQPVRGSISARAMPKPVTASPVARFGPRLTIGYADADGVCTERTVQLFAVPGRKATSFRAYCEARQADRTFRIDRVQWVIAEHGARSEPTVFFEALRGGMALKVRA